ncbi:MAG: lactate racemase domain-containing protein, partial [Vicinamibacterales bacterium]
MTTGVASSVVGRGLDTGFLSETEVRDVARQGLAQLPFDDKRVLVLIPDGTRTMPMPLVFDVLDEAVGPRARALDFLVALGTHAPMSDAQLSKLVGRTVTDGKAGERRIFNHRWDDPASFATLGTIPAREIEELTQGRLSQDVNVVLNRLPLEYDHVLVCGPVFPHEVVGFSGGTKYLFPGIAGPEIIHFTHWLGALITNYEVIGTKATPVRAVIDRAARLLDRPLSLLSPVVLHDGVAGLYCGPVDEAWSEAAALSSKRHVVGLDEPVTRALSV